MNVLMSEKGKLVTNFIIIAAPPGKAVSEGVTSPTTKRDESQPSEEQAEERASEHPTGAPKSSRRRSPKDDYQKNITINVVKCCIR